MSAAANERFPLTDIIAAAVKEAIDKRIPSLAAIGLSPRRYGLPHVAALIYGYTETAIVKKMDHGVWVLGKEYVKAPDGKRFVDFEGVDRWIESGRPGDIE